MFKKMFQKLYKFVVIMIAIILYNFSSNDDGDTKKRDFYIKNMNTKEIYYKTLNIKKEIEKLNNDLVLTKEQKKEKIISLIDTLDNLSKANDVIIPINTKDTVLKEETKKIVSKNIETLNNISINNKIDIKKNNNIKEYVTKEETNIETIDNPNIDKEEVNKETDEIIHKEIKEDDINLKENDEKKEYVYLSYVIFANKILKETKTTIEEIEEDIKNNIYHETDKYKVEILKNKIKKIRENYYEFKHSRYIYELENNYNLKEIDKFEILVNSNNIDNYIKKCNVVIEKIDEYKKHDNVITKVDKKVKVEKKKDKVTKVEEKKQRTITEIEEAFAMVKKDVKKNQMLLDEFEKKLSKIPTHQKRKYRMNFLDIILNTTFKIGLAILPFKFVRNRKLKRLVEAYMVNNSIRTMRKSISSNITCEYQYLKAFLKEADIASDYERILSDSLYQVSTLKEDFIKYYGYLRDDDFKKMYTKLIALENSITMDLERINENKRYINNKVKVLTRK